MRETEQEAWEAADRLISHLDDKIIAEAQQILGRYDSVGQKRMSALHNGDRASLIISPNLWAGIGLVRGGAGTALVGDPVTVAERIKEYAAIGIDSFIFSGYPHLEEAYRTAELLFPLLPLTQQDEPNPSHTIQASGELIAYNKRPKPGNELNAEGGNHGLAQETIK